MKLMKKIRKWIEEGDRKREQLKRDAGLISAFEYQKLKQHQHRKGGIMKEVYVVINNYIDGELIGVYSSMASAKEAVGVDNRNYGHDDESYWSIRKVQIDALPYVDVEEDEDELNERD